MIRFQVLEMFCRIFYFSFSSFSILNGHMRHRSSSFMLSLKYLTPLSSLAHRSSWSLSSNCRSCLLTTFISCWMSIICLTRCCSLQVLQRATTRVVISTVHTLLVRCCAITACITGCALLAGDFFRTSSCLRVAILLTLVTLVRFLGVRLHSG